MFKCASFNGKRALVMSRAAPLVIGAPMHGSGQQSTRAPERELGRQALCFVPS